MGGAHKKIACTACGGPACVDKRRTSGRCIRCIQGTPEERFWLTPLAALRDCADFIRLHHGDPPTDEVAAAVLDAADAALAEEGAQAGCDLACTCVRCIGSPPVQPPPAPIDDPVTPEEVERERIREDRCHPTSGRLLGSVAIPKLRRCHCGALWEWIGRGWSLREGSCHVECSGAGLDVATAAALAPLAQQASARPPETRASLECDHCGDVAIWGDEHDEFYEDDGGRCLSCGYPGNVHMNEQSDNVEVWWYCADDSGARCTNTACEDCNPTDTKQAEAMNVARAALTAPEGEAIPDDEHGRHGVVYLQVGWVCACGFKPALDAADAALAEPQGWQPIATAPKDNKRPLYLAELNEKGEVQKLDFDGAWECESESWEIPQEYYFWASAFGTVGEPTHWAYQGGPPPAALAAPEGVVSGRTTVAGLKAALAKLPSEIDAYEVSLEGCDCCGDWDGSISIEPPTVDWGGTRRNGYVSLARKSE